MLVFTIAQKFLLYASGVALIANLAMLITNGDLSTLHYGTIGVLLAQQLISCVLDIFHLRYVQKSIWKDSLVVHCLSLTIVVWLLYLRLNGYGHCAKTRTCSKVEDVFVKPKLPGKLLILTPVVIVAVTFVIVKFII